MPIYGVSTDYERSEGKKRDYLTVWTGPFMSVYIAEGVSLPKGNGYMLTLADGRKVRVECTAPRTDANYLEVDEAISAAITRAN